MTINHLLKAGLVLATLGCVPASAQISLVNPVPQQVSTPSQPLAAAPQAWRLKADAARLQSFAVKNLQQHCAITCEAAAPFTLTLGVKGDKAGKKYAAKAPKHAEGYYLQLSQQGAVVVGSDEVGLFYGLQTLQQSLAEGKLQEATVTDWPDVPFRGTVEGFYGTPWSHKARLSQIEFYGRNKMNVYIYGPKDDPYHRDHWRVPYPEDEAKRIQELNEHAKQWGVKFYWAIHPGVDIKWNDADRDALIAKFEKMYALGIRAFAVFFDDIWGEGTKADKQAALLNYVDNHFIATHKDVAPLIMCPTEYNRAWANDEKGYLRTLGEQMNQGIEIMWTGNTVVHCIDKESMEWINQRIRRKAYIWWNFPVSDFVRDHILLGPAYGNGLDIAADMSGFVSNPMEHAEASKISLYGIADYTWNMEAYDPIRDWEKGLAAVLPAATPALRTFALYNKDLGPNGHGFRREEGDELKTVAQQALQGQEAALNELAKRCRDLGTAADVLLADQTNPELLRELRPWLLQAKNVADFGAAVTAMTACKDGKAFPTFTDLYTQARSIQQQMYELENSTVRHALQPGIKVATGVMLPTLHALFKQTVEKYNTAHGTDLVTAAEYNPYKLTTDVPQLRLLPVTARGNDVNISPALEVIQWPKDGSLTLEADRDFTIVGMDFNFGVPGAAKDFKLELYSNGQWREVSIMHYADNDPVIHTGGEISASPASRLRVTNISGSDRQVYFKHFKFVKQ